MTQKHTNILPSYCPNKTQESHDKFFEEIRRANSNSEHNISENHSVSIMKGDETKLGPCNDYELSCQIVSENVITCSYCD